MKTTEKINVLDKGWIMLDGHMGYTDADIARFARESTTAESKGHDQDAKLIKFLLTHSHVSPLDHCYITFRAKLPIFVMRQWVRHWSLNFNELSGRYSYLDAEIYESGDAMVDHNSSESVTSYDIMTANNQDIPKEIARLCLPLSTYTRISVSGSLRDWLYGFLRQRLRADAQAEIREYAYIVARIIRELFPVTYETWFNHSFAVNTIPMLVYYPGESADDLRKKVPSLTNEFLDIREKINSIHLPNEKQKSATENLDSLIREILNDPQMSDFVKKHCSEARAKTGYISGDEASDILGK